MAQVGPAAAHRGEYAVEQPLAGLDEEPQPLEAVASDSEDGIARLRLFVDARDGLLDQVLHGVREAGGEVRHVSLTQPSLEDVYIHLTGKELRE